MIRVRTFIKHPLPFVYLTLDEFQLEGYEWLVIMIRLHEYRIESYERLVVKKVFSYCRGTIGIR